MAVWQYIAHATAPEHKASWRPERVVKRLQRALVAHPQAERAVGQPQALLQLQHRLGQELHAGSAQSRVTTTMRHVLETTCMLQKRRWARCHWHPSRGVGCCRAITALTVARPRPTLTVSQSWKRMRMAGVRPPRSSSRAPPRPRLTSGAFRGTAPHVRYAGCGLKELATCRRFWVTVDTVHTTVHPAGAPQHRRPCADWSRAWQVLVTEQTLAPCRGCPATPGRR
jgi:hypothetical protein